MGGLSQTHILVTRAAEQASSFGHLLQAAGAEVLEMPTIAITPPSSWAELDGAIAQWQRFDWLILTSANAVTFLVQRLEVLGQPMAVLERIKIAVVGRKTALALAEQGREPDFMPTSFVADALAAEFPEPLAGQQILFPRVESGGRPVLVEAFRSQGAAVAEVAAYESACPAIAQPQVLAALDQGQVDIITFASSKTVGHFVRLVAQGLGPDWQARLAGVAIASIGPQTSETCKALLGRVDVEAEEYTLEGLTAAIADFVQARRSGPNRLGS